MSIFGRLFGKKKVQGEEKKPAESPLEEVVSDAKEPSFISEHRMYDPIGVYVPSFEERIIKLAEKSDEIGLDLEFIGSIDIANKTVWGRRYLSRGFMVNDFYKPYVDKVLTALEKYFEIGNVVFLKELDSVIRSGSSDKGGSWNPDGAFGYIYNKMLENFDGDLFIARDMYVGTLLADEGYGIADVVKAYKDKDEEVNMAVARGMLNIIADGSLDMDDSGLIACVDIYRVTADKELPASFYEEVSNVIIANRGRWVMSSEEERKEKQESMSKFADCFRFDFNGLNKLSEGQPGYLVKFAAESAFGHNYNRANDTTSQ